MTDHYLRLSYWDVTKNIYYSILFILPMLFLYEIMCFIQYKDMASEIRNGADVFLRQFFIIFGMYSEIVYALFLLLIVLIITGLATHYDISSKSSQGLYQSFTLIK